MCEAWYCIIKTLEKGSILKTCIFRMDNMLLELYGLFTIKPLCTHHIGVSRMMREILIAYHSFDTFLKNQCSTPNCRGPAIQVQNSGPRRYNVHLSPTEKDEGGLASQWTLLETPHHLS